MFTLRNQGAHVVGLLVLSLFVSWPCFAQSQEQTDEQDLARTILDMQVRISALENQLVLQRAKQINNTIQDLQERNSALENQVATLQNKAKEVRVQVGFVSISSKEFPALGKPPSGCPEWTAGGSRGLYKSAGRVDFQEPFASEPKVIMALSTIDIGAPNVNARVHVAVTKVDTTGFNYDFFTWCDTTIHWSRASWIAVAGH